MSVHALPVSIQADGLDNSIATRMERLRTEATGLALAHTTDFERAIAQTAQLAHDIAGGGEAYGVGVRETARRLASELGAAALTLEALRGRQAS
ncbi:MAG TPA: hypothetical protein VMU93_14120 [Caulobacteraceae bacterium]|nr:hypothetical protein [Caulobacteraceae bacterium]